MRYLLLAILLYSSQMAYGARSVMEGISASSNTIYVDTVNARVDIGTISYSGSIPNVGLFVSSNVIVSRGVGSNNFNIIYSSGGVYTASTVIAASSITASAFYGDGSNLTGISGTLSGGVNGTSARWTGATSLAPGSFSDTGSSLTIPSGITMLANGPLIFSTAAASIPRNTVGQVFVDSVSVWGVTVASSNAVLYSTNVYTLEFEGYHIAGTAGCGPYVLRFNNDAGTNYTWVRSGAQTATGASISNYQNSASCTNTGFNICGVGGTVLAAGWCTARYKLSSMLGTPTTMLWTGNETLLNPTNYDAVETGGGNYNAATSTYTIAINTWNGATSLGMTVRIFQEIP